MKKIGLSLFTLCLFFTSIANGTTIEEKKNSSKIGEKSDAIPCTCVFNNKRMWNPEKIIWKDEWWTCAHYNKDGTCEKAEKVKAN